ncbi:TadE/TadG family type IV pilus assembly protein [Desulfolutivibrio sp.]|uniref:TadE/TadG family type IV pilus assembly protein n=1 Tax=Desulfolutivibrio sp. TaxID=2773296 RepID=UPI002F960B59
MNRPVPGKTPTGHDSQRGLAAVEMAVITAFVLAPLLMILVEGSKILGEYSTILSASREAARLVMRENGDATGAADLVKNLTTDLDGADPNVEITVTDTESEKNVKVKVDYVYQTVIAAQSQADLPYPDLDMLGGWNRTLTASTVMPLP